MLKPFEVVRGVVFTNAKIEIAKAQILTRILTVEVNRCDITSLFGGLTPVLSRLKVTNVQLGRLGIS